MSTENATKGEKTVKCLVVTDGMDKSRVGLVERRILHPKIGKYLKRSTRIMFHDEKNETKSGDVVLIKQTKPLSKRKSFEFSSKVGL